MEKLLKNAKKSFIEKLDEIACTYMLIGMGTNQSPMWLQLEEIKDNSLKFSNSQRQKIFFEIPFNTDDFFPFNYLYDFFKYAKYTHIRDNYPTIWEELKSERILIFLSNYTLNK